MVHRQIICCQSKHPYHFSTTSRCLRQKVGGNEHFENFTFITYHDPSRKVFSGHSESRDERKALVDTTNLSENDAPSPVNANQRESEELRVTGQGSFWTQWGSNLIARVIPYILLIILLIGTFTLIALVSRAWKYLRKDRQQLGRQKHWFLDKISGAIVEDLSPPHLSDKQMFNSYYQQ